MTGILSRFRSSAAAAPIAPAALIARDARSAASEAYRELRTNITAVADAPQVILVTSPVAGDGKSITCANLGIVLASTGMRVLLLEADLRSPSQLDIWGWASRDQGRSDSWAHALQAMADEDAPLPDLAPIGIEVMPHLTLLGAGTLPARPAELLASRRFERLVTQLRGSWDMILIDSPPIGGVTDAAIVARCVDGVLVVLDKESPRRRESRRAVRALDRVGAPIIGAVLSRAEGPELAHGYGYGR